MIKIKVQYANGEVEEVEVDGFVLCTVENGEMFMAMDNICGEDLLNMSSAIIDFVNEDDCNGCNCCCDKNGEC